MFNSNHDSNTDLCTVVLSVFLFCALFFCADHCFANSVTNIDGLATNLANAFSGISKIVMGIAYVGGIGLVMAAIFKFKAHKDNPAQIPLGTPMVMLIVGAALIYMPTILKVVGDSVFGAGAKTGGTAGTHAF